jgi:hypothetical protein
MKRPVGAGQFKTPKKTVRSEARVAHGFRRHADDHAGGIIEKQQF